MNTLQILPSEIHNRTLRVVGIPTRHRDDVGEMLITIGYVIDEGHRTMRAVALDGVVIPAITHAVNVAPELLAALQSILDCVDRPGGSIRTVTANAITQARAAIAKAEGRT